MKTSKALSIASTLQLAKKANPQLLQAGLKTPQGLFINLKELSLLEQTISSFNTSFTIDNFKRKFANKQAVAIQNEKHYLGYHIPLHLERLAQMKTTPTQPKNMQISYTLKDLKSNKKRINPALQRVSEPGGRIYTPKEFIFVNEKALVELSYLTNETNRRRLLYKVKDLVYQPRKEVGRSTKEQSTTINLFEKTASGIYLELVSKPKRQPIIISIYK